MIGHTEKTHPAIPDGITGENRAKAKRAAGFRRAVCLASVFCMLFGGVAFAAPGAGASIVSPAAGSVISGDELLVSVKVSDKKKISVLIFEEKELSLDRDKKERLVSLDCGNFTAEDLDAVEEAFVKSYEQAEDAVFEKGKAVGSFEFNYKDAKKTVKDVLVSDPAAYTAVGEAGYFSKKMEKLSPGLYRVQVQLLGKDDEPEAVYDSFVVLKEKESDEGKTGEAFAAQISSEGQKTTLVNSVKKIFKSVIK